VADSSSPAAAEQQQHAGSNADDGDAAAVAALAAAPAAVPEAVAQTDGAGWAGFVQALWQRGYFEEHSSGQDM
jgi:hypothetical protein